MDLKGYLTIVKNNYLRFKCERLGRIGRDTLANCIEELSELNREELQELLDEIFTPEDSDDVYFGFLEILEGALKEYLDSLNYDEEEKYFPAYFPSPYCEKTKTSEWDAFF